MTELDEIGKNIVLLRQKCGLTQAEIAYRANLSISHLQSIEYGYQNTTVDTMIRIAESFGIHSHVMGIFSWADSAILAEIRQIPKLPEREIEALQICRNILILRKMRGLTQEQLARLSNISISCLRDIEHCCANVTAKKLLCIARAFGMSLTELNSIAMREEKLMEMVYKAREKAGLVKIDGKDTL